MTAGPTKECTTDDERYAHGGLRHERIERVDEIATRHCSETTLSTLLVRKRGDSGETGNVATSDVRVGATRSDRRRRRKDDDIAAGTDNS